MKKKLLTVLLVAAFAVVGLAGCGNKDYVDTVRTYDKAIIDLHGEVVEVDVKKWKDYDGEQIQIIAEDGTVYLTSSYNCTLIREK